jgi:hypothetical protein
MPRWGNIRRGRFDTPALSGVGALLTHYFLFLRGKAPVGAARRRRLAMLGVRRDTTL